MGTFTFGGLAVHYLDEGAGDQTVLFVHGFPFRASMWEPEIPVVVEAGRRAVALDLPGFGRSDGLGAMMRSTAPVAWIGALEAMKQRPDRTDGLAAISVPVLVVVGEGDVIAPPEVAETMAKAIPGAHLEVVPDAGHVANLENPDVFNRALTDFLAAVAATGPDT